MHKPILIIQMHRLGDIVLTFPLMGWLERLYPDTPVWVLAEEAFYKGLVSLSPRCVFFPHEGMPNLRQQPFSTVINLSHTPEAAAFAGSLSCESLIGPYRTADGTLHVKGDWQLYRTSLVHNNRYNLFHWADMNALDLVPSSLFCRTMWPPPRVFTNTASAHIGLFLGASQPDKHPDAEFWTELAGNLLLAGHRPVLLGGASEKHLGRTVAEKLGAHALDMTGRFSIAELCRFIAELDLMITPDTGPMHLAAWTGTPVLNLSTGPVNAWETGPFSPGHHVVRAALPCVGCWQCTRKNVACKERMHPRRTAFLVHELIRSGNNRLSRLNLPGQELLRTVRDQYGLYALDQLAGKEQPRQLSARLWQTFFGSQFGILPEEALAPVWCDLVATSPNKASAFGVSLLALSRDLAAGLKSRTQSPVTQEDFWSRYPLPLRPLTSYIHMVLQNEVFARSGFAKALALVERLVMLVR